MDKNTYRSYSKQVFLINLDPSCPQLKSKYLTMRIHMVDEMKEDKLLLTLPLKEQQGHSEPVQDLPVQQVTKFSTLTDIRQVKN